MCSISLTLLTRYIYICGIFSNELKLSPVLYLQKSDKWDKDEEVLEEALEDFG